MSKDDLKPEGITPGSSIYPGDLRNLVKLPVGQAERLVDLTEEYAFFTPALMHLIIPELPDLVAGYEDETGVPIRVFKYTASTEIFKGLAHKGINHDWDHTLLAVPIEHSPHYQAWVASSSFIRGDHLFRLRIQDMPIIDPLEAETKPLVTIPSLLPVQAFVIDSTVGCIYFEEKIVDGVPVSYTAERRETVLPETAALRDALMQGRSNPYDHVNKGEADAS